MDEKQEEKELRESTYIRPFQNLPQLSIERLEVFNNETKKLILTVRNLLLAERPRRGAKFRKPSVWHAETKS